MKKSQQIATAIKRRDAGRYLFIRDTVSHMAWRQLDVQLQELSNFFRLVLKSNPNSSYCNFLKPSEFVIWLDGFHCGERNHGAEPHVVIERGNISILSADDTYVLVQSINKKNLPLWYRGYLQGCAAFMERQHRCGKYARAYHARTPNANRRKRRKKYAAK